MRATANQLGALRVKTVVKTLAAVLLAALLVIMTTCVACGATTPGSLDSTPLRFSVYDGVPGLNMHIRITHIPGDIEFSPVFDQWVSPNMSSDISLVTSSGSTEAFTVKVELWNRRRTRKVDNMSFQYQWPDTAWLWHGVTSAGGNSYGIYAEEKPGSRKLYLSPGAKYMPQKWMSQIPDSTPLSAINIPGTHDTCTAGGLAGWIPWARCQDWDLPTQLENGIRFIDVRAALPILLLDLGIWHGIFRAGCTLTDVLNQCKTFLANNPSECIVLLLNDEHSWDSASAFAGGVANDTSHFPGYVDPRTGTLVAGGLVDHSTASVPTLGNERGRILLLRRFQCNPAVPPEPFGIDLSRGWADNATSDIYTPPEGQPLSCDYHIEDNYMEGASGKESHVSSALENSRNNSGSAKNGTYWGITYTSLGAAGIIETPRYFAGILNPWFYSNWGPGSGYAGTVVMDYPNAYSGPQEIRSIINSNWSLSSAAVSFSGGQRPSAVLTGSIR